MYLAAQGGTETPVCERKKVSDGTTTKREPFEKALSPKVQCRYGFKDAHAVIRVTTPVGIVIPVSVTAAQIATLKKVFEEALGWTGGETERQLDPRAKVRFGFPDGHVDLCVKPIVLSPWIPLALTRDEIKSGKPVMEEVCLWAGLPQDVRSLQGVD
jgi:hypothetical protein